MKHKVIIADDSQTIQKVIKITLANENFELVECLDASNLIGLTEEHSPSLVLLDFNLSEDKTGYDLSKELKEICSPKILMLYGTFDTVDESLFVDVGINGHIVKPFDGTKFISLCRQLAEDSELEEDDSFDDEGDEAEQVVEEIVQAGPEETEELDDFVELEESHIEEQAPFEAVILEEDEWVVNQPETEESASIEPVNDDLTFEDVISQEEMNKLEAGMQDWGIDIPGVIGAQAGEVQVPPVIGDKVVAPVEQEETYQEDIAVEFVSPQLEPETDITDITNSVVEEVLGEVEVDVPYQQEDALLPQKQDLEYPDVGTKEEKLRSEPELVELDELVDFDVNEDSSEGISLDETLGTSTEDEIKKIEAEISDEVGEQLWSVDEVVEEYVEEPADDQTIEFATPEATAVEQLEESTKQPIAIEISEESIEQKVEQLLAPMLERMVQEKVESIIEKISWEIIPDLAENLIKTELKQVTQDVLGSESN
jgi:DNA-binding response OmpR family regulator